MSTRDTEWLNEIIEDLDAMSAYLERSTLDDAMAYDACLRRMETIGEAVKNIDPEVLNRQPHIAWTDIARQRDRLAHHYRETSTAMIARTIDEDLPPLRKAVEALLKLESNQPD